MLKGISFAIAATAGQKAERDNKDTEKSEDNEVPDGDERPCHEYQTECNWHQ